VKPTEGCFLALNAPEGLVSASSDKFVGKNKLLRVSMGDEVTGAEKKNMHLKGSGSGPGRG